MTGCRNIRAGREPYEFLASLRMEKVRPRLVE